MFFDFGKPPEYPDCDCVMVPREEQGYSFDDIDTYTMWACVLGCGRAHSDNKKFRGTVVHAGPYGHDAGVCLAIEQKRPDVIH